MKIVLDTNVIIYAVKNKIDLHEAVSKLSLPNPEIVVPDLVLEELETIQKTAKKGSDKSNAKLAIQIIKFSKFKIIKVGKGHTDDLIFEYAKKNMTAVITNDTLFKRKLKAHSILVFSLRQKKYLK